MPFSLTTGNPLAVQNPRTYNRFSDVAKDMVDVRIYQGIHFRFADRSSKPGRRVAKWAFTHYLRPVDDDDEDDEDEKDHG